MVLTISQARRTVSKTPLELPFDIIIDILFRLPVKSLLRFKSVSKTWYNLIKTPDFTKQHLICSKQNPKLTFSAILSIVSLPETCKQIFRINLIDALHKPIDIDLPFMSDNIAFNVVSICNGLVCVRLNIMSQLYRIAICNPLTGEFRLVPGTVEGCTYFELIGNNVFRNYCGFGLNGDNGYEFFRIVYKDHKDESVLEGEAYSLTSNTWRKIDIKKGGVDSSKICNWYQTAPIIVHGVFYWRANSFSNWYVVSFDLEKEVFEVFLTPFDCKGERWDRWNLCDLKEEVAVVIYYDIRPFDIWVLNEREKSWELKLQMEEGNEIREFRSGSVFTVLGYAGSGELVIEDYDDKTLELFLYDMYTDDAEDLPYVNVGKKMNVFLYTESLVSVNAGDEMMEYGLDLPEKRRPNVFY